MHNEQKVKINLIGTGCHIVKGIPDTGTWNKMLQVAGQLRTSIDHAVFDSDFFPMLDSPYYKKWSDLNNIFDIGGLLYDSKSFIEIWIRNKKKLKVYFKNIMNENLLFPLYNIALHEIGNKPDKQTSILIMETEIGMVSSYTFHVQNFEIERLKFCIQRVAFPKQVIVVLDKIYYAEQLLVSKHSDTLVTGNSSFIQ